jgi:hypothetical protein
MITAVNKYDHARDDRQRNQTRESERERKSTKIPKAEKEIERSKSRKQSNLFIT